NFEYNEWGKIDVIGFFGEIFIVGYQENIFTDGVNPLSGGQISKVLINEDKKYTIHSGSALILDEGYVLDIIEVDKNGDKVFVSLSKEGREVDSSIISASEVYVYTATMGSYNDIPIIAVHFDEIFQETETYGVFVDGIFQISDNSTSLNVGDNYGNMKITSLASTGITMENNESVNLLENSIIPIMGNIQFKVADDIDNVRFYPYVEVEIEIEALSINYFSPVAPVLTSYVDMDQEFRVNTNEICNFTWFINGNEIQKNNSAFFASYVNNAANVGFYNVTVVAETSDEVVQHTWNWTVTEPLSIDYFSPVDSYLTSYMGVDQEFQLNTSKICNFTWLINGNEIQNNNTALSASYVNNTANPGFYNVKVVAETSDEVVQHTWNWTVTEPLSIDYFSPVASDHTSYMGVDQEFQLNTSKICNFTWLINGNEIQNNNSALSASYV
ncbi:MAG: hypothetical protein KAI86_02155, partial [Desulfobacterales bacterium]|nr:hypothetical protein [Desulfobacterales bacterium]